jgi:uncharacterized membrane protein
MIGAIIGCGSAIVYGVRIWLGKEKANLATWTIILTLDGVGLYLAFATGNDEAYIQIGWCLAALMIVIGAWKQKGDWVWTENETQTLILCIASVVVWLMSEAVTFSLLGYIAATAFSVWPQAKDYIRDQVMARKSAWIWQVSIIAIVFPIAAKLLQGKYGAEHLLLYGWFLVLNVCMAALCMRKPE